MAFAAAAVGRCAASGLLLRNQPRQSMLHEAVVYCPREQILASQLQIECQFPERRTSAQWYVEGQLHTVFAQGHDQRQETECA